MVTMGDHDRNRGLKDMNERFYRWTELIQSSPEAIQESVASVIGGGYRKCNLVLQELRFNPMFRNRRGERDLDHIINAARWGLERALVEYPKVRAVYHAPGRPKAYHVVMDASQIHGYGDVLSVDATATIAVTP
jgi:hypothetical protein